MQEFAPFNDKRNAGNHPSDEDLAAYIDGTLAKAEKRRITAHLASCEDCYDVYAGAVRFQLETESTAKADQVARKVVPFPAKRSPGLPWWYSVAALLLVGIGVGWYGFQAALIGPAPKLQVADVAPEIHGRYRPDLLWDHARFRGGGVGETDLARQSFQVGALLVDFRLSAEAGDAEQASETWRTVGSVLRDVLFMKEDSDRILAEANRLDSEEAPEAAEALSAAVARTSATEAEFRDSILIPEYLDFGKWTEAGRLAAKTGNHAFFKSRENRRFLAYVLRNREVQPNEEVRRELQKIARIWDEGDLDDGDFKALAERFKAILDQYEFLA